MPWGVVACQELSDYYGSVELKNTSLAWLPEAEKLGASSGCQLQKQVPDIETMVPETMVQWYQIHVKVFLWEILAV